MKKDNVHQRRKGRSFTKFDRTRWKNTEKEQNRHGWFLPR